MTTYSQPVYLDRSAWFERRDRDDDFGLGSIERDRQHQLKNGPWCPVCGEIKIDHDEPYPCVDEDEVNAVQPEGETK